MSDPPTPTPPPASPRATFRPHERIRHPKHFQRAFERKRSASDALMVVHGVENGLDYPRLGISVSRRKIRKATARNRVKRRIREAFRLSKADLPRGVDLVVVPRSAAITFEQARRSLCHLARAVDRRLGPRTARAAP